MCGVVGILTQGVANDKEVGLFKGLLLVDQIRGEHATGVAKVNTRTNEVSILKKAMDSTDFLALDEAKAFLNDNKAQIYIGHNRYATMGDKTKHENAHPFQHEHITMVHNGGVDPFGLDLLEGYNEQGVDVDSHMVCMTIAKHGAEKAIKEHLAGAFALVWWDSKEKSLNFIRNIDRPLYMAITTAGALVWASEKGMLDVFLKRSGRATGYRVEPILIPVDTLHTFKFDNNGMRIGTAPTMTDMEFVELSYPKYSSANEYWWQGAMQSQTENSQRSQSGNNAAEAAIADRTRVNRNLEQEGCRLRKGSLVTFNILRFEPYATNQRYGVVYGECVETSLPIQAWGISAADIVDVSILKGNVNNAYTLVKDDVRKLTVTVESVGISCHDPKYSAQRSGPIGTLANTSASTKTSPGDDAKIAAEKIIELRNNTKPRVTVLNNVRYPLKVHGHTFGNPEEFRAFAAKGCSMCNSIPTAYDSRNINMSVYEGNNFAGLIEDCEFICGKCEGE